jgi:hypothetical protein
VSERVRKKEHLVKVGIVHGWAAHILTSEERMGELDGDVQKKSANEEGRRLANDRDPTTFQKSPQLIH